MKHDCVKVIHVIFFQAQTCNKDIFEALEPKKYSNWLSDKQQLVNKKMLVYYLPNQTPHVIINVYVTDNSMEESILKAVKCANEKSCSTVLLKLSTQDTVLCSNLKNYSKCLCSAITRLSGEGILLKRIKLCVEQENVFQKLKPHLEMEHDTNGVPTAPERPKRKKQLERRQKTELQVIITAEKDSIPKVISAIDSLDSIDRDLQQGGSMLAAEFKKKGDLKNKSPDALDLKTSLIQTVTNLSPDSHKEMENQGQNHKGKPNKKDDNIVERSQSSHHSEKRICLERTKDIDCLLVARFTANETGAEILKQHISLKIQGPVYVLSPYQGNKMEALLVYKSLEDAEKAYSRGSNFNGFRIEKLPPQVLFNISAEVDSNFVKKLEKKGNSETVLNKMVKASGGSYKKLGNGGLQLCGILPQIELALEILESYLEDDNSTNTQNEMSQSRPEQKSYCIDKVPCSQKDYEAFLFFFNKDIPKLQNLKNGMLGYDEGGIEIVSDDMESVREIKCKVQEKIKNIHIYKHEDLYVKDCDHNMCLTKSKEMQDEFPNVFFTVYGDNPHHITLVCPDVEVIRKAKCKLLYLLGKTTERGHRNLVVKENEVPSEKSADKSSDVHVPLGTDPRTKLVPVPQRKQQINTEASGSSLSNLSEDQHKPAQAMSTNASRRNCDPNSNFIPKIETRMHQKIEVTEYSLTKNTKVCIYEEDMLNSYAEAIACGDDEKFQHKGHIAKEVTSKLLIQKKNDLKAVQSSKKSFSIGEVLLVSKERARDSNILHVFFVITPMWTSGTNEEDFLAKIKECFTNVLHEATVLGVRSVALPLLGTGNPGSPIHNVVTILHEVILQYVSSSTKTEPLREIHIVNKTFTHIVKEIFLASDTPQVLLRMDGNLRKKSSNVNHNLGGTMTCRLADYLHCLGHEKSGTFIVAFNINGGQQRKEHPYPGKPFKGITKKTYIPNSSMGKQLLKFLHVAFHRGLLFEIKKADNYPVICKNIEHKSSVVEQEYPDPDYCERTIDVLRRLGIRDKDIEKVELPNMK